LRSVRGCDATTAEAFVAAAASGTAGRDDHMVRAGAHAELAEQEMDIRRVA
jgi:hypothetical protein